MAQNLYILRKHDNHMHVSFIRFLLFLLIYCDKLYYKKFCMLVCV